MRRVLFNPSIFFNGVLWIVGLAMQLGGWGSHTIAYGLLITALVWSVGTLIYWLLKRRDNKHEQRLEEPIHASAVNPQFSIELLSQRYQSNTWPVTPERPYRVGHDLMLIADFKFRVDPFRDALVETLQLKIGDLTVDCGWTPEKISLGMRPRQGQVTTIMEYGETHFVNAPNTVSLFFHIPPKVVGKRTARVQAIVDGDLREYGPFTLDIPTPAS